MHDKDDFDSIYGVSKKLVPQGPNPLHNWSGWAESQVDEIYNRFGIYTI